MSYPWWRFRVRFADGHTQDFIATDLTPTYAMQTLLTGLGTEEETPLSHKMFEHGDVESIQLLHCETYGVDEVSDKQLVMEAARRGTPL